MSIPLPHVDGASLELVIEWLKLHKDDPIQKKRGYHERRDSIKKGEASIAQVDKDFMKVGPFRVLFIDLLISGYEVCNDL